MKLTKSELSFLRHAAIKLANEREGKDFERAFFVYLKVCDIDHNVGRDGAEVTAI